jgi:hypothetical protein
MTLHETMATAAFPTGAWLKCANPACNRGERVTREQAARYLATGWPTHCGLTMELTTNPHRAAARAGEVGG